LSCARVDKTSMFEEVVGTSPALPTASRHLLWHRRFDPLKIKKYRFKEV
jgi:hypothetical protein